MQGGRSLGLIGGPNQQHQKQGSKELQVIMTCCSWCCDTHACVDQLAIMIDDHGCFLCVYCYNYTSPTTNNMKRKRGDAHPEPWNSEQPQQQPRSSLGADHSWLEQLNVDPESVSWRPIQDSPCPRVVTLAATWLPYDRRQYQFGSWPLMGNTYGMNNTCYDMTLPLTDNTHAETIYYPSWLIVMNHHY